MERESIESIWQSIGGKLNDIAECINNSRMSELNGEFSYNFYSQIYQIAEEIREKSVSILKESPGDNKEEEILMKMKMPVAIKEIAECFHIYIGETPLPQDSEDSHKQYRRRITYLMKIKGHDPVFFVDPEAAEEEVRYAIAFGIGQYMSYYSKNGEVDIAGQEYTLIPMLPKDAKALVADALAIALLVPLDDFVDTFNKYLDMAQMHKELPIRTEWWLEYLSGKAGISFCDMAIGYQQLRYAALARRDEFDGYKQLFLD